jgi:hypothetical protein
VAQQIQIFILTPAGPKAKPSGRQEKEAFGPSAQKRHSREAEVLPAATAARLSGSCTRDESDFEAANPILNY